MSQWCTYSSGTVRVFCPFVTVSLLLLALLWARLIACRTCGTVIVQSLRS